MDRNTLMFQPDGNFIRVSQLANGTLLRYWGQYRVSPAGPNQLRLESNTTGWLPRQFCSQAPGFPMKCSPVPHPAEMTFMLNFTSPSTIQAEGLMLVRDASPALLQQNVPEQAVLAAQAPTTPVIQQPVVPGGGGNSGGGYRPISPPGGQCDDLQQQRICSVNNGYFVNSGGCLKCISP
jgi:hypothetical protein